MCGRYSTSDREDQEYEQRLRVQIPEEWLGNPDSRPTDRVPIVACDSPDRAERARWALIAPWAKTLTDKPAPFNARSDSLDKALYRGLVATHRCLIPASSFFEWPTIDGKKRKTRIASSSGILLFAGLFRDWMDRTTGEVTRTCTIITCDASQQLQAVHDRMPVILDDAAAQRWNEPGEADAGEMLQLLQPYDGELVIAPA